MVTTRCRPWSANALALVHLLLCLSTEALPRTSAMPLRSALDTLAGKCWRRKVGGYTYEWCHEQHVLQIHTAPTLLGKFQRWRSQEMHTHVFGGGEACAGAAGGRQAQVRFKCCSGSDGGVAIRSVQEPRPCFYQLEVCVPKICPEGGGGSGEGRRSKHETKDKRNGKHKTKGQRKRKRTRKRGAFAAPMPPMPAATRERLREEVRAMFTFAYDSYMQHAFPAPELAPVSCRGKGFELSGLPMVTLIDALDTLAIMGNGSEFRHAVQVIEAHSFALPEAAGMHQGKDGEDGAGAVRDGNELPHSAHRLWRTSNPRQHVGGAQNGTKRLKWARDWAFETRGAKVTANAPSATSTPHLARSKVRAPPAWPALFDVDRNVSLFETNIRVLGGLLSGHLLAEDAGLGLFDAPGVQPYTGSLLRLAHDLGARLLPAFQTATGIPFGTVNLREGVPPNETTVASLAGAGTLSMEFGMLSVLTGDKQFGSVAHRAARALFARRDANTGLLGKHIDTATGQWVEATAGIGNGADSFYEYLLKSHVLFGDTSDRSGSLRMFEHAYSNVSRWLRIGDWFGEANIGDGSPARLKFEGLQAFWPGLMVLAGDIRAAAASLNAFYAVWRRWNGLPEQVSFPTLEFENGEDRDGGRSYPLRPELIESTWMLHRATGDDSWLWAGKDVLETLQRRSRVECGFSIVADVAFGLEQNDNGKQQKQHVAEGPSDSMPSFFLSETLKYLYLLFESDDHFLHQKPGGSGIAKANTTASLPHQYRVSQHRAGWIMTTEAHPMPLLPEVDASWQTEKDSLLFPYSGAEKEAVERRAPSQCVATHGMQLPPQHRPFPYGADANTCAFLDPEAKTQDLAVRRREAAERETRQDIRAQRRARADLLEALQNTSTSKLEWPELLEEEIALDRAEEEEEDDEEEDEDVDDSDFLSDTSWDFSKHQVSTAWSWSRWRSWQKGQVVAASASSLLPNQEQQLVGYSAYATSPWPLGYRRLYTVALSQADNAMLQRRVQLRQQQVAAAQESMKQQHFQVSMASLQQQIASQLKIGNLFAGFSGSTAATNTGGGGGADSTGGGMAQQLLSQVASQLQRAMGLGTPAQQSSRQGNAGPPRGDKDSNDDDGDDGDTVRNARQSPAVQPPLQQAEQVQIVRSDDIGSDGSSGRFEVLNFDGGFRVIRLRPESVSARSKRATVLSGAGQTVEVSGMASHAALVQHYDAEDVGIDIDSEVYADVDARGAPTGAHASNRANRDGEHPFARPKRPPFVSLFHWLSAGADPGTDSHVNAGSTGWNGGRCLMDSSRACFVAMPPSKAHRTHHAEKVAAAAASRRYAKSDRVRANWKGLGRYYGGKVHLTGPAKTYTILYDDGDMEADVPHSRILPPPEIQANEQRIWHTVLECVVQVFEGEHGDVTEGSPEHRFACAPGLFGPFIEGARDAAMSSSTPRFEYDTCFFAEGACPTQRGGSLRITGSSSGRLEISSPLRACSPMQLGLGIRDDNMKQEARAPVVLAMRGGCSFEAKARAAQEAGAAALIVVDTENAPLMAMAAEGPEDVSERDSSGTSEVNIPVALVTADTGSALLHLARMPRGARARVSLRRPGSLDPTPTDLDDAGTRAEPPPVEAHDAGMMIRASGNWSVQSIAVAMAIPGQAQPMTTVTLALRSQNASGW